MNIVLGNKTVCTIIVNYRTAKLTIDCLKSLMSEKKNLPYLTVIVVDNDSGDNSVTEINQAIIEHNWQEWVSLIASEKNGGFAYGNNLAIKSAQKENKSIDYFWLLNPDTVVRENALTTLIEFMENNAQVGIAGSRLEDFDRTGQQSAFCFRTIFSEIDSGLRLGIITKILSPWVVAPAIYESNCQTDWVAGASMIIRPQVFDDVGLLDEEYFMYCEEMDFCLQARKAGWSCWYVPESRVVHLVGQSSGIDSRDNKPPRRPKYWFESRTRYFIKNHGWLYTALTDILWMISFVLWKVRQFIQNKEKNDPPFLLQDFFRNSILYPSFLDSSSPNEKLKSLGLLAQIKEDWIAHGKDWTKPGFRAVAVQRFGVWRMKIQPLVLRAPFSVFYRMLFRKVRNTYGIELPYTVQLGRRVIFEHQSGIVIHGCAVIGDDCIIRQGVTIGNRYVDKPSEAPKLGKKVNIGAGAKIFGNIEIGDEVNIGANAVVLKDIPAQHTAVGIPAKIISLS